MAGSRSPLALSALGRLGATARLLVLAGCLLLALLPATAGAHAYLDRAEPAPGSALASAPSQVRAVFTEPVEPNFSRLQVLDTRRQTVDSGDSRVAPDDPRALVVSLRSDLPDGVYTVVWRTLSAVDGHAVSGAYTLLVGTAAPTAATDAASASVGSTPTFSPETVLSRWWLALASSALLGTIVAWRVVFQPVLGHRASEAASQAGRRADLLAVAGGIALVLGVLYGAVAQAAVSGDVPVWGVLGAPLRDTLTNGRFATIWWPRLLLACAALALVAWSGVRGRLGDAALVATAGVLLTSSLVSHGAALASGASIAVVVDWLHFLAVAAWLGGLATLVLVLPVTVAAASGAGDRVLGAAVARFSAIGLVSVGVIITTGTFQTWLQVGVPQALVDTGYGLTLLVKIALLAGMMALAAFNLLGVRPRLALASTQRAGGDPATRTLGQRFRWAVRGEVGLGVLALIAAAVLAGLPPGREELARHGDNAVLAGPVDQQVDAQGLVARIQVSPNSVGINRFAVELTGQDPRVVERVQLSLTYLDADQGTEPLLLDHSAATPGRWEGTAPTLSQPGQWQVELFVRRTGQDDARTAFRLLVAGPEGGAAAAVGAPTPATAVYPLLPSNGVAVAYALVAAGLATAALAGLRWRSLGSQNAIPLLAAGLVVVGLGAYLGLREEREGVTLDVVNVRNPVPPDPRSLATGKETYDAQCALCHGDTGRGDGPAGIRLVPRPADLRAHMAAGHTDGQLFYWVSYGVAGTGMPGWKDKLSEQQRWDVINYLRTFATPAG